MSAEDRVGGGKPRLVGARGRAIGILGLAVLIGVGSRVPVFPQPGGGWISLIIPLAAAAPLALGPVGGTAAAAAGGVLGMFLTPAAFPLGSLDVLVTAISPAVMVALAASADPHWRIAGIVYTAIAALGFLFPFHVPGEAAGFGRPPEPLHFILCAMYWFIPLMAVFTSSGRTIVSRWVRCGQRRRKYPGVFMCILAGLFMWWITWTLPYWYLFHYSAALGMATLIRYSWWIPALAAVTTALAIPVLELFPYGRAVRR
ncbi:MAG: hypothetical protein R6U70_04635 [Bacillota bacterium]